MGVGTTLVAGIFFGTLFGISIMIVYFFFKTKLQNRRALKKNPNIVEEIKLNKKKSKEILNEKEGRINRSRGRSRRNNGFTENPKGKSDVETTNRGTSNKKITPERRGGISISTPSFTLRD